MSCTGRSRDCTSTGLEVPMPQFTKMATEWEPRVAGIESSLETLKTSAVAMEHMMRKQFDLLMKYLDGGPSLGLEFDKLLTMRLQPLKLALDDMRVHEEASYVARRSAPFGVGNGFTDVTVKREEITVTRSLSDLNVEVSTGEEGKVGSPRAKQIARAAQFPKDSNDSLEALQTSNEAFLEQLKQQDEHRSAALLAGLTAFLADLKKQHNELFQVSLLSEVKQQQAAFLDQLSLRMQMASQTPLCVSPREVDPIFQLPAEQPAKGSVTEKVGLTSAPFEEPVTIKPALRSTEMLAAIQDQGGSKSGMERSWSGMDSAKLKLKPNESLGAVFLHDEDPAKRPYNVEDYYKKTGCAQEIARNIYFQNVTLFVVFLNAIWIGVDSNQPSGGALDAPIGYQIIGQSFNCFFFFEWLIRLFAFTTCKDAMKDGWFEFDTFLVWTMVLDSWVLVPIFHWIESGSNKRVPIPTQPLRVIRILKLTRMAKLMNNLPELVTMIKGLVHSLRAIVATVLLVLLMNYVWAIILHMTLKDEHDLNERLMKQSYMDFTSVGHSMWILLMDGTLMLDNAAPCMTELIYHHKFVVFLAGVFFTFYALISALLILQMLIGVLCDVVSRVNAKERDGEAIALVKQELLEKLMEFDTKGDGTLSREDLFHVMSDRRSVAVLRKLKINRGFLYQLQCSIFAAKDRMEIRSALELLLLCRDDNAATVEILAGGFCFVGTELHNLHQSIHDKLSVYHA